MMVNSVIDNKDISIELLVNNWDLPEDKKKEKVKILESWKSKIDDEVKFSNILRICNKFRYYSPKLTEKTYKNFWEETKKEYSNFDEFLKTTLFTPLRSRERIESSIDMFSQFRLANNIDANSTFIEGPITFIRKFKERKNNINEKLKIMEDEDEKLNQIINNLKSKLQENELDLQAKRNIKKEINSLEKKIVNNSNQKKDLLNQFNKNYYYVKNIVIIDDFIGTGSSGEKLVKRLANELQESGINIKFHLWVLEAGIDGKTLIEDLAKSRGIDLKIKFGSISQNVLLENLIFMKSELPKVRHDIDEIIKDFKIPKSRYSNNHALASFVNAPNNNLALLSNSSEKWEALFLRIKRIEADRIVENENELKDIMQFIRGGK